MKREKNDLISELNYLDIHEYENRPLTDAERERFQILD